MGGLQVSGFYDLMIWVREAVSFSEIQSRHMYLIGFHGQFMFSAIGGIHGVPRVHYKGRQGEYYVMVCHFVWIVGVLTPFFFSDNFLEVL